jgi:tRNA synthetases class I (E and Q), anti-codon binding domain
LFAAVCACGHSQAQMLRSTAFRLTAESRWLHLRSKSFRHLPLCARLCSLMPPGATVGAAGLTGAVMRRPAARRPCRAAMCSGATCRHVTPCAALQAIDPVAPRHTAVAKAGAVRVRLTNGPPAVECRTVPKHKKNPDVGKKTLYLSSSLLIDQADAAVIKEGEEVRWRC